MLRLSAVDTFYGPIPALKGVTLEVHAGEIVCLLGGNASGKSPTMKIILGLQKPRSGAVLFDGQPVTGLPTPQLIRRGIGSVPEARRLFGTMTVRENVLMGAYTRNDRAAIAGDYQKLLDLFPRLAERRDQQAGTLSGGEQQMLAIARGLMARPKLLMLDEPTWGIAPKFVTKVLEVIQQVNASGVSILLVEQNLQKALSIAHHGYVIQTGRIVMQGEGQELLHDERIRKAYLGL
jgi:branched-chain amino acid transport system ATP-binding protein